MGETISIGGKPINHVAAERVLEQISMVDQDVFSLDDTIRENIRHARPNATDEEIEAACREANCDGFIRKMEKGYDTPTGENGNLLSGGERQRISIARAILKNSPILLLDEATASLDIENELAVKAGHCQSAEREKTVVMIAHTLSIVKNADQILWYLTERLVKPVLTMNCWLKAESMRPCGTPNRNYLHKGGLNETSCVRGGLSGNHPCSPKETRYGTLRRCGPAHEVSKPSVCHAVATLRDGGFLTMDEDHFLHLTDVGREVAEKNL